jgi:hypothetical protein
MRGFALVARLGVLGIERHDLRPAATLLRGRALAFVGDEMLDRAQQVRAESAAVLSRGLQRLEFDEPREKNPA